MAEKYLGEEFDIHIGGEDHIAVHHTNEIAQCQAKDGHVQARYWLHGYFLQRNDEKLSKSGTSITLSTLIDRCYDPLAYRLLILTSHYRSHLNFTWQSLDAAQKALNRLRTKVSEMPDGGSINDDFQAEFIHLLNQDVNMPQALALMWEVLKSDITSADKKATLCFFDSVLGIDITKTEQVNVSEEVKVLIEQRVQAKQGGDYLAADNIREQINKLGYQVNDCASHTKVVKM